MGENVGIKLFELMNCRDKTMKRETKELDILKYIY